MMALVASVHVTGAQEHRGTGADEYYVAVEATKVGSADMDKMNADLGLRREGQYQQGGFAKEGWHHYRDRCCTPSCNPLS
jgi:hypothetical protein